MSREIKFRGWYGEKLGMLEPSFNGNINEIFAERNGFYMQYTGLKDKHGRKIYEGDIVLRKGFEYEIKFEIGSFMLVAHDVDMYQEFVNCWNDNVYPLSQLYWENDDDENWISDLEVIGNKYEGKLNGNE